MQSHVSATFSSLSCRNGVCVVDGYGVRVRVNRRQLVVSDGIGRHRRERIFAKALADIQRLVILGHEGFVTLEALRWMNDAGIAFLQIDRDGKLISGSAAYGLNDARLRRAQAAARDSHIGLDIARHVLTEKLAGQEMVLARAEFTEDAAPELSAALETARNAGSLREILFAEADGALAYWRAWGNVAVRFAKKDEKRIPEYWRTFEQRGSPIAGSPRLAANPANAMLNYLYALLEQETRFACLTCGLDPGLGVFHADQASRDSLALDLMEAVRPQIDSYLLDLLATRTFTAKDFVETRRGVCRVLAPVTHTLAETTTAWATTVAPVVEHVCRVLAGRNPGRDRLPTPLTQANRSAGRDAVHRAPKRTSLPRPRASATCERCGGALPRRGRRFCDVCLPDQRQEQLAVFATAGPAALARLRATGHDPVQAVETKRRVGEANARRRREEIEWNHAYEKPDPEVFRREILPRLQNATLQQMRAATGLSEAFCARIRRGYVPHARHWERLGQLGAVLGGETRP